MCHHVFSTFSNEILFRHDIVRITLTMEQAKVRACGDLNYEAISEAINEPMKPMKPISQFQHLPTSSNLLRPGGGTSPTVVPRWRICQVTTGLLWVCGNFTGRPDKLLKAEPLGRPQAEKIFSKDIEAHRRTLSESEHIRAYQSILTVSNIF